MKKMFRGTTGARQNKPVTKTVVSFLLLTMIMTSACTKSSIDIPVNVVDRYSGISAQTAAELKQAQAATERYRNIENAKADGYSDISVEVEHMGFHYMKASLADAQFECGKPELLVYNKDHSGQTKLVAVEYAVPIALRPNSAPEGFTGNADVWKYDTGFGLWLLHAWVWEYNPSGVFNPTNPLVHLH